MTNRRVSAVFLAFLLFAISWPLAYVKTAAAADVKISLDLTEFGKLVWQAWQSSSAEAKKAVRVQDLLAQLNVLVGQRESFLPRFKSFLSRRNARYDVDQDTAVRLRNEATAMLGTVTRIQDMVKRLDSNFAASHSEVHIEI